jgi:hypothetical protein
MKGEKSVVGKTSLGGAVSHLKKEHPEKYDDLGPHRDGPGMGVPRVGTHMPLAGLKPHNKA